MPVFMPIVKKDSKGFFSKEENDAGGMTYAFKAEEGGGVEFNIAYGDTEPEDITKLWVKTSEPRGVAVSEPLYFPKLETDSSAITVSSQNAKGVKIGTKIYRIGGGHRGTAVACATVFDFETMAFEQLPKPPDDLYYATHAKSGLGAVGTKIYIIGGSTALANANPYLADGPVTVYDTETETYRKCESAIGSRFSDMACEVVGTKIYLLGGTLNGSRTNKIFCFDTDTEVMEEIGTMSAAFIPGGSVAIGTKIYIFGGKTSSVRTNSYCYDTEAGTMTSIQSLPVAEHGIGCCFMNGLIYLFGGEGIVDGAENSKAVVTYDPETNKYTTLAITLPENMSQIYCVTVGENIYLFGGANADTGFEVRKCMFDPMLNRGILQICPKDGKAIVKVANTNALTLDVPVNKVYKGNNSNIGEQVEARIHNGNAWVTI